MQRHPLLLATLVFTAVFSIASFAQLTLAATTISTNIVTAGTLQVGGQVTLSGDGSSNGLNIANYWNIYHILSGLDYLNFQPNQTDKPMRLGLFGNGTISGGSNALIAGIKIFQTTDASDLSNSCDFGMYMTSSGMRFNTKHNGTCAAFPIQWGNQDTNIDMTLSTIGNLGIGTENPSGKLDISGAQSDTIGSSTIMFTDSIDPTRKQMGIRLTDEPSVDFAFDRRYGEVWYEAMRIQRATGNIGIGTTTPNRHLTISNSDSLSQIVLEDNNASSNFHDIGLKSLNGDFSIGSMTNAGVATTRFTIASTTGNVGIGTAVPGATLAVTGNALISYAGDTALQLRNSTSGLGNAGIGFRRSINAGTDMAWIGINRTDSPNSTDSQLIFQNSKSGVVSTSMMIDTAGKVGIGTTSPASLLTVSAGASATTTVEFGDQYSATSKSCFNVKTTAGASASFYFNASGIVFEANRCR